jgi:DedD protein
MPIRSDAPELAVDELKRRARRRLVGAIVLALAAAVILPLLLESDPKPLGDEVSIRIPPIDNGKFINPLAPDRDSNNAAPIAPDSRTDARPSAAVAPKKSITDAERRILGQPAAAPPSAPPAVSAPIQTPATTSDETPPAASTPAPSLSTPTPTPTPAPAPAPAPANATVAQADVPVAASGGFAVQVGAFADTKVAAELAAALKLAGFVTYTEAVPTTGGSVQRVRVGPYATRGAADSAVAKLKLAGYDRAMVTTAK